MHRLFAIALAACLCSLAAWPDGRASDARPASPAAPDGGPPDTTLARPTALSAEDQEVVENLELLENLDQLGDLELLQELTVEQ